MAERAERDALEQHRPVAAAGVVDGLLGGEVRGDGVHAVDLDALHGVGRGAVDDRGVLGRVGVAGVLAVLVVLADEHDRQRPHRRQVERLVERADVGRPVAEVGDRDLAVALELRRQAEPDGDRHAGADDAGAQHEAVRGVGDVHRPASPLRRPGLLAEHLGPHLAQGNALGDLVGGAAVGGGHVVVGLERGGDRSRDDLVAADRVVGEERLGLADQRLRLVVEGADPGDGLVDLQQQAAVEGLLRLGCDAHVVAPRADPLLTLTIETTIPERDRSPSQPEAASATMA